MPLHHARIYMAQILRHHQQGHPIHHGMACPGVTQAMKADSGRDLCSYDGFSHRTKLMRNAPLPAEHRFTPGAPGSESFEKFSAFIREYDVAGFVALALADRQHAGVSVAICDFKAASLAVPAAGLQRRLHQGAEFGSASDDEPPGLRDRQIANTRRVDAAEGLHFAPSGVRRDKVIMKGVVERSPQDRPSAIC